MKIRQADFAGSWYPASPRECEAEIQTYLKDPKTGKISDDPALGGITPHAGWYFSGDIACNVIHRLSLGGPVDTVVIFGMHLHPDSPGFIMTEGAWETPFGPLEIDEETASDLAGRLSFTVETTTRYNRDNTIELQLPFVKYFFKDAGIVPVGIPPNETAVLAGQEVVKIAEKRGRRIRVIGSTDLTHYGFNYGFIPEGTGEKALDWVKTVNDKKVIDEILSMNPLNIIHEGLTHHNACCSGAAAAAVSASKAMGADTARMSAYATSHDKNPGNSFVGYVGVLFQKKE